MEQSLLIYNSLTRKKEPFHPINPPYVGLYVCGPTVYKNVHIGNVRSFLSFDMVYRYLTYLGYKVRYVRNITDVGHLTDDGDQGEDKLLKQARIEKTEPMEIVQRVTNDFREVMLLFNAIPPSIEPTATGHIVEQIGMIENIIENGFAYEKNGSVYFNVRKYHDSGKNYGILSGRKIEDLISNTRELDGQAEKDDPLDFALWKKAEPEHIMKWPSPWGDGFPGWHLECSVMSTKYLGEEFDIHGGGMDLKFPHHECEIAQNVASTGVTPVRYWMHGNMLTVNNQKMAKSAGNVIAPREFLSGDNPLLNKGFSPMVIRFFLMQTHYTSTLDFSNDAMEASEKGFRRLMDGIDTLNALEAGTETNGFDVAALKANCVAAMNDDFNTPILVGHLFDGVRAINSAKDGKASFNAEDLAALRQIYTDYVIEVLGLEKEEATAGGDNDLVEGLMQTIIELRANARENKDWGTSDKIRDALNALKVEIKDGKEGSTWKQLD